MNWLFTAIISSIVGIAVGLTVGFLILLLLTRGRFLSQIRKNRIPNKEGMALSEDEIGEIRAHLRDVEDRTGENTKTFRNWAQCWNALLFACQRHHAIGRWAKGTPKFVIDRPATEKEVRNIENILKCSIPDSFKHVLLAYASRVDISWQLPDEDKPPEAFRGIFSGECRWDLQELPELLKSYQEWIDGCFTNPDDPYDAVWHDKFPVAEVGNGDMLGIDLGAPRGAVIYLSHDDGAGHGYRLGNTFEDFVDRMIQVGCPGYEDWQWLPFTSSKDSMIDPQSQQAQAWRKWFGLEIAATDA